MKAAVVAAVAALESRTAELRHAEAELEAIRQSHYEANDALHAAQGALGEAALDVSRLEERIRYVAEGRQRIVRQRADLEIAARHLAGAPGRGAHRARRRRRPDRRGRAGGRRLRRRASPTHARDRRCALEAALREAQARATASASVVAGVQQQIQVAAAEMRGVDEQAAQAEGRRDRLVGGGKGPGADRPGAARRRPAARRRGRGRAPRRRSAASPTGRSACRRSTRRGVRCRPRPTTRPAATPISRARLGALQALQEKVQIEDKLKPWLARHGLESLPGLWRGSGSSRAGSRRSRRRCASASARSRSAGSTRCAPSPPMRRRPGWRSSPRRSAPIASEHRTLPRLTDLLHLGDSGLTALLGDWLEGVYTASRPRRSARRPLQPDPRRSDHDPRRACRQPVRGQLLRARFAAGRTARPRPGDREPRAADAGAGDLCSTKRRAAWFAPRRRAATLPSASRPSRKESARGAVGGASAAGGAAAPDAAGRADQPAARAAERRARRARSRRSAS